MGDMSHNADLFAVTGLAGEKRLSGTIPVAGAKNEVLKVMAAAVLIDGAVHIENVPAIEDVARMRELLIDLGATVEDAGPHALSINTAAVGGTELTSEIAKRMRASVVLTGPLLARFGEVSFPHPGGCVIGTRPIDIFLESFVAMGATIDTDDRRYRITAPQGLHGADIFCKVVSVTATETIMLAATRARGTTTIKNAATEPEIGHLAEYLVRCGARITGAGTHTITIEGVERLQAPEEPHVTLPDRIETASFMILGALAAKDLHIAHCVPAHVEILTALLRGAGVPITVEDDTLVISGNTKPNSAFTSFNVRTHEYPGFPTDAQSPTVVFLTQSSGESTVFETIWENRLSYTQDLIRMGANITVMNPQQIIVKGPTPLRGRDVEGPDLRAGLAFLIAATVAEGTSHIRNAYFIDRGYEHIEARLGAIGISISRKTESA